MDFKERRVVSCRKSVFWCASFRRFLLVSSESLCFETNCTSWRAKRYVLYTGSVVQNVRNRKRVNGGKSEIYVYNGFDHGPTLEWVG